MKKKLALIFPVLMMVVGAYALIIALGSDGDLVTLVADQAVPKGLAIIFGLLGLGGGIVILTSGLSKKKMAV